MKKDIAKRKGFINMDNIDFEYIINNKTGEKLIQIKNNNQGKLTKDNITYEIIIDPNTGQQTLRMKQEVEVKCNDKKNYLNF